MCACHRQQTCLPLPFWHKKYGIQVLSTVVCWPGEDFDLKQSIARPSLTNLTKGVGNNTTVSSRCCHKVLETTPLCLPGVATKCWKQHHCLPGVATKCWKQHHCVFQVLPQSVGNNTTVSSRCCHKVLETTPLCLPGVATKCWKQHHCVYQVLPQSVGNNTTVFQVLPQSVGNNTTVSSRCCHKVLETTPLCLPGVATKCWKQHHCVYQVLSQRDFPVMALAYDFNLAYTGVFCLFCSLS